MRSDIEPGLRADLASLSAEEQESRVLIAIYFGLGTSGREWFAAEVREAFDRALAAGLIEAVTTYRLTEKGKEAALKITVGQQMRPE